jgi:two-component system chemotaxis response regulator CheB
VSARIRVLLVDDSAFARKVVRDVLSAEPDIDVVGIARNGIDALEKIKQLKPHVVTLDLMMPELDGVGLLNAMADWPDRPHAVVVTTLDEASDAGLAALVAGAFELVQKPTPIASDRLYDVRPALVAAVRAAGTAPRGVRRKTEMAPVVIAEPGRAPSTSWSWGPPRADPRPSRRCSRRCPPTSRYPSWSCCICRPGTPRAMPIGSTARARSTCSRPARSSSSTPGRVAIARAGMQLTLAERRGSCHTCLSSSPLDALHRPSVDVLFASAAALRGPRVLGVVLTGMGDDGMAGARAIRARGGRIMAEAESTCVVYGMPRAVIENGLANDIVPLDGMAAAIAAALTPR